MIYPPEHTTLINDRKSNAVIAHSATDEYILEPKGGHRMQIFARHEKFLEPQLIVKSFTKMEDPTKIAPFKLEPWMEKKYENSTTLEFNFIESYAQREPSASALFFFTFYKDLQSSDNFMIKLK
jgi:hypothetical protein